MDFLTYLLGGSSLRITEQSTGLRKWQSLSVISVEIMASSSTSELPQAATSAQIVEISEGASLANVAATKIIMPTGLVITVIVPDQSVMDSIINAWMDLESLFDVTSRNIIANNMALTELDITQDSSNISACKVAMTFEQTNISRPSTFNPQQSADRDMLGIEAKQPMSLTTTMTNLYNNISSKLGL